MNFIATADGVIDIGGRRVRCALGHGGVKPAAEKREGDGATPLGAWPIRRILYRPDKGPAPVSAFPTAPIERDDGWCDAPDDAAYNRPVKLPYPASAEEMWREDGIYDVVVVLGHNDVPPVAQRGSCIFLHLNRPGYSPTQGCVAVAREDLQELLRLARPGDAVEVAP